MKKNIKIAIKVATAVLAAAVVLCLATPTTVKTDKATIPVKAAMVTEISTTTTPVATSITTTATSTTSTSTTTTLISTSTSSVEETEPAASVITAEVTEAASTQAETPREYIVYKPSTHYIHKSTCHWFDSTCYEITDTNDIECRKCSECNPNLEIMTPYVEPTPVAAGIDDYSRQLLAEIIQHEAGSNWISQYNKAKVAAGVMNRVNDSRFPNTVYSVLVEPNQFSGYWPGCNAPSWECYDAVDYYFTHTNEFNSDNSWYGDGYQNHFYYQ